MNQHGEIILYQTEDGLTKIDVRFEDETVWLTQAQLCDLYQTSKSNISEHIKHIFAEGELEENQVVRKFRTTAADGKSYNMSFYNLDMIISLGYRVKSLTATRFRQWATARLKEYMIKGFVLDDERLKGHGGGDYWKELLDRIRDIRSSEKVMYRQVLDLYATSQDYDPASPESVQFFKIVKNKLHYAAHGHTAAELIFERANAEQEFMGLRSFAGEFPVKKDTEIAKNYLDADELRVLNNPPFGKKSSLTFTNEEGEQEEEDLVYNRQDFWTTSSNNQLNFVQHINTLLKATGKAAVVVPDNVLFEGGAGETVRQKLLWTCDLHTILRLPTGIFYKPGIKANMLFFDKRPAGAERQTKTVWVYDFRTNVHFTLKQNPMTDKDLEDFVACYHPENRFERTETWSLDNPDGRWRCFDVEKDILPRDKTSLDLFWIKDKSLADLDNLPAPDVLAADIIENLQSALESFSELQAALGKK